VNRVTGTVFEGLFIRGLRADEGLKAKLLPLGVNLDQLETSYPTELYVQAVRVAREHLHPDLPPAEGMRSLGRFFARGFLETIVGKVISIGLPMLGPAKAMANFPRYASHGGKAATMTLHELGPTRRRLTVDDAYPMPDFVAGIIEVGLEKTRTRVKVVVEKSTPRGYELLISW
jgi:uncharacterized protein (TIGR02265 family)